MLQLKTGIATGLGVGKTLLLFGTVEKKAKRFHVNLLRKNGDIALHFNPRFDEKATLMDKNDEQLNKFQTVVRNSLQNNEWGNEEKEGKMPFEKGVGFDLAIQNEAYAFNVGFHNEQNAFPQLSAINLVQQ